MKTTLKTLAFITSYLLSIIAAYAADSIQNVHSTTHQLNGYDTDTEIAMSWDAYTGAADYYYAFNTVENYTITDFDNTTPLTSITSDDFQNAVNQSSNSAVAYYFHIATKTGNFFGWTWTETTSKGPYYIDIKAPSNVNISGPETTSTQVVTLNLYADDNPTEMNISNTNFGEGTWVPYATSTQWSLKSEYGSQTVFVLFRDALGNTTDGSSPNAKTTINYIANTAPDIRNFLVDEAKTITGTTIPYTGGFTPVGPQILFDLYDNEGGEIVLEVTSSNLAATTLEYTRTIVDPYDAIEIVSKTITTTDSATTTYTITDLTADEEKPISLIIMPSSESITSAVITLTVKDSGGLTDTETITFNLTEDLLVKLSEFSVTPLSDHIHVKWQTTSEIDTAGFILKRSETKDGLYTVITERLIPATGSSIAGASYSYRDNQVDSGKHYFYQLVEIDLDNNERICMVSSKVKRSGDSDDDINYDANGDNEVNIGDVIYLLQQLTKFQESESR
jgi:hypothetical protein